MLCVPGQPCLRKTGVDSRFYVNGNVGGTIPGMGANNKDPKKPEMKSNELTCEKKRELKDKGGVSS